MMVKPLNFITPCDLIIFIVERLVFDVLVFPILCSFSVNSLIRLLHHVYVMSGAILKRIFFRHVLTRRYTKFDTFVPVFKKAHEHMERRAIEDDLGEYSYGGLLKASVKLSKKITEMLDGKKENRVGFMCSNDANFLIVKWALWMSGQIAVPLCCFHPTVALEYFLDDLDASLLIASPEHDERAQEAAAKTETRVYVIDCELRKEALVKYLPTCNSCDIPIVDPAEFKDLEQCDLGEEDSFYKNKDAMIIYTSGSTGTPKGVKFSHVNIYEQVKALVETWKLDKNDSLLHIMPNHRGQSIVVGFAAPLSVGARIVLMKETAPDDVWLQLLGVRKTPQTRINVFITHPHMYLSLIKEYEKSLKQSERMMDHIKTNCQTRVRLMSSGCGPITPFVYKSWESFTGHHIQESFSMAETGVVMAMPLHGTKSQGKVGIPISGVHIRLTSEKGDALIAEGSPTSTLVLGITQPVAGMLQVRSDGIFGGYWRKPTATQEVLTRDGWFKTGDLVHYSRGLYEVYGKMNTEVIKSGKDLYSTIFVEAIMRDHPDIVDAAVVALKNLNRGEFDIFAAVKLTENSTLGKADLLSWLSNNLPKYAIPTKIQFVRKIPRTWQGKADRDLVLALFDENSKV